MPQAVLRNAVAAIAAAFTLFMSHTHRLLDWRERLDRDLADVASPMA